MKVGKNMNLQKEDEVKMLINEAKIKNHLTDEALAKKIGVSVSTLHKWKLQPGFFRLDHIWLIEQLAGRELNQTMRCYGRLASGYWEASGRTVDDA